MECAVIIYKAKPFFLSMIIRHVQILLFFLCLFFICTDDSTANLYEFTSYVWIDLRSYLFSLLFFYVEFLLFLLKIRGFLFEICIFHPTKASRVLLKPSAFLPSLFLLKHNFFCFYLIKIHFLIQVFWNNCVTSTPVILSNNFNSN